MSDKQQVARQLGRYTIVAQIGDGGMAHVHLALQEGLGNFKKLVVLKLIHKDLAAQPGFVKMLLEEARIAAQLKHPNVVDIYDADCIDGTYFIAMEYLAGQPLTGLILKGRAKRKLDVYSTTRIIADAAKALEAAHGMRSISGEPLELVHRDVSPGNVMVLYDGSVKLVDFGVAKAHGELGAKKNAIAGKLGYAAPEQLRGEAADRRADIFGLGVVFWETLTHKRLFSGKDRQTVLEKMKTWKPVAPSVVRPGIPAAIDQVVLKALRMDPEQRFPTAKAFNRELEKILREANFYRESSSISDYMDSMFEEERKAIENLAGEVFRSSTDLKADEPVPLRVVEATSIFASVTREIDLKKLEMEAAEAGRAAPVRETKPPPLPKAAKKRKSPESAAPSATPTIEETVTTRGSSKSNPSAGKRATKKKVRAVGTPTKGLVEDRSSKATNPVPAPGAKTAETAETAETDKQPAEGAAKEEGWRWDTQIVDSLDAVVEEHQAVRRRRVGVIVASLGALAILLVVMLVTRSGASKEEPTSAAALSAASSSGSTHAASAPGTSDTAVATEPETKEPETKEPETTEPETTEPETKEPETKEPETKEPTVDKAGARQAYREGIRLTASGKLGAAKRRFNKALELNPRMTSAYRGLGVVYEKQGSISAAKRMYKRYLRRAPKARDADAIRARLARLGG